MQSSRQDGVHHSDRKVCIVRTGRCVSSGQEGVEGVNRAFITTGRSALSKQEGVYREERKMCFNTKKKTCIIMRGDRASSEREIMHHQDKEIMHRQDRRPCIIRTG